MRVGGFLGGREGRFLPLAPFKAPCCESENNPALMPAPAAVGDHVFGVLAQCTGIQVREVADKGEVGVRSPEEFSRLVRVSGPAGRVMQKLVDDRPPQGDLAARTNKLLYRLGGHSAALARLRLGWQPARP